MKNSEIKKKKIIIVGGGTSGLTIANRLQNKFDIVVLEKSTESKFPIIFKIPLMIGLIFRKKDSKFISKRFLNIANGRTIPFFESNVLGGASVINGCVHTVGNKIRWEELLSKFGADYDDVIESFNNSYSRDSNSRKKINIKPFENNLIDDVFLNTLNSKQFPIADTNYSDSENCGYIYNTTNGLFRNSVLSICKKNKFEIYQNQNVDKLIYNKKDEVIGVKTNKGKFLGDYVILSSGVIGTCKLLLQEKIINSKNLKFKYDKLKIGENFQDHTNLRVNVKSTRNIGSLNEISKSFMKKFLMISKHLLGFPTLLRGTGATSALHLDLDRDGLIDTRIQMVQFTETGRHGSDGKYFGDNPGFSLSITPINPHSTGTIKIIKEELKIEPKYLNDVRDIKILKKALRFCVDLLNDPPISEFVEKIYKRDQIKENPEKYIWENIFSGHHFIGGTQDAIDQNFKIKGFHNMYICDASIMSNYCASNIHSSVVIMSEIFSKRFLKMQGEN